MTQPDRDRLLVLKKAQKDLITQRQAVTELDVTERHVRRLLRRLKSHGDGSVIHGLRGQPSHRRLGEETREKILGILSKDYPDFGPTLANDYTLRFDGEMYRIARADVCAGLRGATVRIECRLDGSLWVRFRERYLAVSVCPKQPPAQAPLCPTGQKLKRSSARPAGSEYWRETQKHLLSAKDVPLWAASQDRTRTRDKLD